VSLAPLVSALRYRFYLHDHYAERLRGLARPAETIEDAIRKVGQQLQTSKTPEHDARALTTRINTETRSAFDGAIAGWENDIAIALGDLGRQNDFAATATNLTAQLQGIDRGYKRRPPNPDSPDQWFDLFDIQIAHLSTLAEIQAKLAALPRRALTPDAVALPRRSRWPLLAGIAALVLIAGGAAAFFLASDHGDTRVASTSQATSPAITTPQQPVAPKSADRAPGNAADPAVVPDDMKPKVVRTISIPVTPADDEPRTPAGSPASPAAPVAPASPAAPVQQQAADTPAAPVAPPPAAPLECKAGATVDVAADGAYMSDRPGGGLIIVKLSPNEKVMLKRIVEGPNGFRVLDVESAKRKVRGYIGEADAKKPAGGFPCS